MVHSQVFVYALEGEPETLDPAAKRYSERAIRVKWLLFDSLINIGADGRRPEPGLAESWAISDSGRRVDLTIRRGVRFHDGTPLDVEAVKHCFDRQFARDLHDPQKQVLRAMVADVPIRDSHTLGIRLRYDAFDYLARRYLYKLDVLSPTALARGAEDPARHPVGTGPFCNPEWLQDRIILSKNPDYWAGPPTIDEVHFRYIPDGNEALERLLAGEVHFVPSLSDPDAIQRALSEPRLTVMAVPGFNVFYLGLQCRKAPFDQALMRQAVVRGIDVHRAALAGKGAATPACGPLPVQMEGFDPAVRQHRCDPKAAADLLRQAGYDGRPISLIHYGPPSFIRDLARAVERDLCGIGLNLSRREMPTWADLVKAAAEGEGHLFLYSWHMRTDDAQGFLRALCHSSNIGVSNLTGYASPEVDRLLDLTPPREFSAAQATILADAPIVFIAHWTRVAAHAASVRNLRVNRGVLPDDKLVGVGLAHSPAQRWTR
jgi:ABC-type transport system substrate-binding protein